ncbi:MAG: NAD(P)/FAD-dependent oxidoreductase [Burkholderiaceae bacterium]|nr:NAD(P)/FAD-dependent oxidoreductase [Burkholderiaceae bacterium]
MEQVDTVVVGAGVVGLAVARALALAGRELVILEAEAVIGSVTSARNSEVIHAGLYSQADWLKTRLCTEGRRLLYPYCESHGIAHRRCGKLVVAADDRQSAALQGLARNAQANGVEGLQLIDGAAARRLEPALHACAALHSTATGIIDSHGFMLALLGEAQDHGAVLALKSPLRAVQVVRDGLTIDVGGAEPMRLQARCLVNCAGLAASHVAARIEGLPPAHVRATHRCKGNYFALSGVRAPFSRLIYPLHGAAGLGVHLTLDLAGQGRFGPDTEWLPDDGAIDYTVNAARGNAFYAAIRQYWPGLPDGSLQPDYSGVRPKLSREGESARDFAIDGPDVHGVPGLVNLFGIESPGLTASLAIAGQVAAVLRRA